MIKGIHTSAMAMRQGILRQEITADNLANASTTAFKRDRLFARELLAAESAQSDPLAIETERWTDFAPGAFNPTGDSFDLALQNRGFFVLNDGQNDLYTRNGHFERSADGQMVDVLGRAVQGEGGNITLPAGLLTVSADGQVSVNGTVIDRLRVVDFGDPQTLQKVAGSAFMRSEQTAAELPVASPIVRQGFLEGSNVDTVHEMVNMISTARTYEINARLLTTQDETLRHTVNEVGRV